ncbi:hypothetical protein OsJ_21378 [Oryza sativa Japonica Group]|uniref:Uncharacterized protein n=1 Tax=Oryza sativa subsp. japonica TaxID=39947 RepID=B9FTC2_ORYSJ|nr:hypothetical protein OsJ_21378 [Oryza sativa Japonica Group]
MGHLTRHDRVRAEISRADVGLQVVSGIDMLLVPPILLGELLRLAHHPVDLLWLRRRLSLEIVIFSDLPVALSAAYTLRMSFTSMSKVTSICGSPLNANTMPVVNTCVFFVCTTVLHGINLAITPAGRLEAEHQRCDIKDDHASSHSYKDPSKSSSLSDLPAEVLPEASRLYSEVLATPAPLLPSSKSQHEQLPLKIRPLADCLNFPAEQLGSSTMKQRFNLVEVTDPAVVSQGAATKDLRILKSGRRVQMSAQIPPVSQQLKGSFDVDDSQWKEVKAIVGGRDLLSPLRTPTNFNYS